MNLEKNSIEMNTIVETFVIEETASLIYDDEQLEKWNEMVESLGLVGQKEIVVPTKSPIPFLSMNQSLQNIASTLCPRKVELKNYNLTPIPVEILDLCVLALREEYFQKIEIWYDEVSKDPFCVGITGSYFIDDKNGRKISGYGPFKSKQEALDFIELNDLEGCTPYNYSSESKYYLLGKWADVKRSFEELKEIALKRLISEKGAELRKKIKESQRKLDDLEVDSISFLAGNGSSLNF